MIKAILFDSGRVLNESSSGHWFIPPKFFNFVSKEKYNNISKKKINEAFRKAGKYIISQKLIKTKEEEYKHFISFYEIFSEHLPELQLSKEDVASIAKDLVYNVDKYRFYDDALKVIPRLKKKYKLGVVSDAWPSLKGVYDNKGLYNYFEIFVISSILGVTKPDKKMYLTALTELNLKAEEAVFIDDNLRNCNGARKLGIKAMLLCRDKGKYYLQKVINTRKNLKVINNLEEIDNLII